jgi:hypothetical protein
MAALDEKPFSARSGRSIYYGGGGGPDGDEMTDYQRQSLDLRQAATASTDSFRAAETARKATEAAQKATATDSRFRDTMDYRRGTQAATDSRFRQTMDYRRSGQAGVQSRFDQAQALREETEARQQDNDERSALQSARRFKLDADKDARAIDLEEKRQNAVAGINKEFGEIEAMWEGDERTAATLKRNAARKYPLAGDDERTRAELALNDRLLERLQVPQQLDTALGEIGEFDPSTTKMTPDQQRQYLGTIRAKYTQVVGEKAFTEMLKSKADQIDTIESRATQKPEGLEPSSFTTGPDGKSSTTYRAKKEAKDTLAAPLQAAYKMASDNFEKAFDNRRSAQDKMDKLREEINLKDNKKPTADQTERMNSFQELIKVADKELDRQTARRDAAEAEWDENRGRKKPITTEQPQATIGSPNGIPTPAAPAAPSPVADKPKAVRQNGKIYRLQPDGSYKE